MRLTEVRTLNPVFTDANEPVTFLRESNGYTLTLEQGIVTIAHAKMTGGRIVPFAACSATPMTAAEAAGVRVIPVKK